MLVDKYLEQLNSLNGSDLYLSTNALPSVRVDGVLVAIADKNLEPGEVKRMAYELMGERRIAQFEQALEMNLSLDKPDSRFRVNVFKQRGEVSMVIRKIKLLIPTFEELNLPTEILKKIIMRKRGIIFLVGATGSGKSSTLAAMLDYRNTHGTGHIITVEDPIEFIHSHKKCIVDQREIGFDTLSYQEALANTLRQAPDVIMIGEIRTAHEMEHAISFAETGHLCFSTLHATNANQAFTRMMSFFPLENQRRILLGLSLNITAIISQRLIPKVDGGRIPAVEILLDSPLVKELIKRGEIHALKEAMKKAEPLGMQTFDTDLYHLYRKGLITLEDALQNADSPNDLQLRINTAKENTLKIAEQIKNKTHLTLEEPKNEKRFFRDE